jgi:hypothetical protein
MRQTNRTALRQAGDRLMYHVAQVIRLGQVDPLVVRLWGGHGGASSSDLNARLLADSDQRRSVSPSTWLILS